MKVFCKKPYQFFASGSHYGLMGKVWGLGLVFGEGGSG
jgi:hypothetical protein